MHKASKNTIPGRGFKLLGHTTSAVEMKNYAEEDYKYKGRYD